MNHKNTNKLYSDFPQLFKRRSLAAEESPMFWGIQCEDGWFEIIYELSSKLNNHDSSTPIEITEIKQKWGSLTFRVNVQNTSIKEMIIQAEERAKNTCEYCGMRNAKRYICRRWRAVMCESCAEKGEECAPE